MPLTNANNVAASNTFVVQIKCKNSNVEIYPILITYKSYCAYPRFQAKRVLVEAVFSLKVVQTSKLHFSTFHKSL